MSQSADGVASVVTPFPPEVWMEILRYLDINSLLNVAEALPNLKDFAFTPKFVGRVAFDPQTDERTLLKFVQATRQEPILNVRITEYVRELHFTNCISLSSTAILSCAQFPYCLRVLDCVNCVVEPAELYPLLSQKLVCVTTLQWSLYDEHYYESKHSRFFRLIKALPTFRLESMCVGYVATHSTEVLLWEILWRCPKLRTYTRLDCTNIPCQTREASVASSSQC